MLCLWRQRAMQGDDVRGRKQAIERHRLGVWVVLRRAARVGDAHAERPAALCHGAAYAAVADGPKLLSPQIRSQHEIQPPSLPLAATDEQPPFAVAPRAPVSQGP